MKNYLLIFPAIFAISSLNASASDSLELTTYIRSIDYFNIGEGTRAEVQDAQLAYLNSRRDIGDISKTQYCYEAGNTAAAIVDTVQELARVGQRSQKDLAEARKAQNSVAAYCASK